MLCRSDIHRSPRAPERERLPAPDPFEIGAGNRSRARLDLSLFRRVRSDFERADGQGQAMFRN